MLGRVMIAAATMVTNMTGFFSISRRNLWGKNRQASLYTRMSLRSTDARFDDEGNPLPESEEGGTGFNEYRVVGTFREPRVFSTRADLLLTGFVEQAAAIRAKGVDEIICLAVNDPFVMGAWGEASGAKGKVRMVADGNGELTRALGLELDASGFGMGKRSQRYAMIIDDGKVKELLVEPGPGLNVSSAQSVLAKL